MTIVPHKENHLMVVTDGQLGRGNFAKLSSFPGYFRWVERNAVFRATGANLEYVLRNWPNAEWIGSADEVRLAFLQQQSEGTATATAKRAPDKIDVRADKDYKYRRAPMHHQRQAFVL